MGISWLCNSQSLSYERNKTNEPTWISNFILSMACLSFPLRIVTYFLLSAITISPSPATSSVIPPIEGTLGPVHHGTFESNAPSSVSQPIGSSSHPELAMPPLPSAPAPQTIKGLEPSLPPSVTKALPPFNTAPPPLTIQGHVPAIPPTASQEKAPVTKAPISVPIASTPPLPPQSHAPPVPTTAPPRKEPVIEAPIAMPVAPGNMPQVSPAVLPSTPETSPVSAPQRNSADHKGPITDPTTSVPVVSPTSQAPQSSPLIRPTTPGVSPSSIPDHEVSPAPSPPQSIGWKKGSPVAAPSFEKPMPGHIPANGPSKQKHVRHSYIAPAPSVWHSNSPNKENSPPVSSPSTSFFKHNHTRDKITDPAPASSRPVSPPTPKQQEIFPSKSPSESPKVARVLPLQAFPPPPPNEDCSTTICTEPYTNTPPGSPCGCVLPIQVGLRLSVALYTFFPLVSELAQEIAAGVFIKQSQVRIIGANAANQQPEKTVVLVDLVPLGERFDNTTAFLTYQRFWSKQVTIQASYFGDYEVLYVRYPGLPASPPSDVGIIDDGPYAGTDDNGRTIKPLGVDVPKRKHKDRLSGGVIAIIVISALLAVILCSAAAWVFIFKHRDQVSQPGPAPQVLLPTLFKPSGAPVSMIGSRDSSASLSFGSSIATYTGAAKTFSTSDIERATDHFNASRILGEGGFGRVYSGILDDGTKVAVKVLKRDDQQGGREFLAEVEMLSRLHHRNLVKLIGICTEESTRCLVYELIPNGSVESHLHGMLSTLSRYVAPEYAMTGHLLVKSDVYSYGVVLLELLTGRKPVDMSQPPGQENLVAWARPLLANKEGLETIVDPSLGSDVPFDSIAKVAAIASMSVQPEVSNRPFMGEVVQALKLVCNEIEEAKELGSRTSSQDDLSIDLSASEQLPDPLQSQYSVHSYESELDIGRGMSVSELFSSSARLGTEQSESFRRHSSSGPLGSRRSKRFWRRVRGLSSGSVSEHVLEVTSTSRHLIFQQTGS
ncbi:Tyrosine-protein kinase [Trema orientale]|uniref:Tyrosine-protein kinase n=1 Tax=Trema orientale TaxID=63057 RepID=A0A2P5BIW0_TREOI|nr:Tyrosine-protein kinase [Trema orientale]